MRKIQNATFSYITYAAGAAASYDHFGYRSGYGQEVMKITFTPSTTTSSLKIYLPCLISAFSTAQIMYRIYSGDVSPAWKTDTSYLSEISSGYYLANSGSASNYFISGTRYDMQLPISYSSFSAGTTYTILIGIASWSGYASAIIYQTGTLVTLFANDETYSMSSYNVSWRNQYRESIYTSSPYWLGYGYSGTNTRVTICEIDAPEGFAEYSIRFNNQVRKYASGDTKTVGTLTAYLTADPSCINQPLVPQNVIESKAIWTDSETGSGYVSVDETFTTENAQGPGTYYIWLMITSSNSGLAVYSELSSPGGGMTPSIVVPGVLVYLYNGSSWVKATPYIYNGSAWVEATPDIYTSSGWVSQ